MRIVTVATVRGSQFAHIARVRYICIRQGQTQKVSKLQRQGESTLSYVTVVHKVIGMLAE